MLHLELLRRATTLRRPAKRLVAIATDLTLVIAATIIAYSLRIGSWILWDQAIAKLLTITIAVFLPCFILGGVYSAIFRFAGRGMMRTILRAGTVYGLAVTTIVTIVQFDGVPRTVGVIQPIILVGLIVLSRLVTRYLFIDLLGRHEYAGETRTLLIYGAGKSGQQLASSTKSDPAFRTVGYLDDDARLDGQNLDGLPVFSSARLRSVVDRHGVTDVLLAMPSLTRARRREIMQRMEDETLRVQTLPPIQDIVDGKISINDIRDLEIEDLLGREAVAPNALLLGRTIVGKTVLVTGAGGSIGSELCRQILAVGARRLVLFEVSEFALYSIEQELAALALRHERAIEIVPVLGSVVDAAKVGEVVSAFRPDTIYHAAAYKHVPLVEANPLEGIRNNVLGTLAVVRAALAAGTSDFILISTDKAVRPPNVMGATKRAAELILQASNAAGQGRFSMVRFGNVLGSSGSVVPLFRDQIAKGGPITLTHREVTRFFMTIPEAAQLVIQAGGLARGGEVFVLDMGQPVRIADLAETMVRLSGLTVRDADHPQGDIAIEEVGLRPGEKLYEELLLCDDPQPTKHPRIFMAHEASVPLDILQGHLDRIAATRDPEVAVAALAELVPEFGTARAAAPLAMKIEP